MKGEGVEELCDDGVAVPKPLLFWKRVDVVACLAKPEVEGAGTVDMDGWRETGSGPDMSMSLLLMRLLSEVSSRGPS